MVVSLIIYGLVAAFMIGIGVSQLKSKTPVGFYTGEKPPKAEELTDVDAWNKKHGGMWLSYGAIILLSWFIGFLAGDSLWALIPLATGVCVPLVFMVLYHSALVKRYKR